MKNIHYAAAFIIFINGCHMDTEEKMDKIFSAYNHKDLPGAAVMVIYEGKILFRKGYGLADVADKIPITENTNFRLASVTKQFTAACISVLIKEHKLSLNTTLKEIFSEFPTYGSGITIKHLLQHTSGLIDYEDLIPNSAILQVKDKDVLNMMLKTDSTYFIPGTMHRYSNTGYAMLAMTVEKISGKPFREFLKENIFNPLGMDNTLAFEKGINEVKNRAYGYTLSEGKTEFTDQSITSAVLGDGGIYSSLNDLFKWDQSLFTNEIIDSGFLKASWTKGITNSGEEFQYGFAWHLESYHGNDIVYHTGSTRGFRNIIYRIPQKQFSVIILTNRNSGEESITLDLAHQVVDLFSDDVQ